MFQNLMSNPYSSAGAGNPEAAYIQAVYRPHPQYGGSPDSVTGDQSSIRSSPSWPGPSAGVVGQQSNNDTNHVFGNNHTSSPFSSRFPFQVIMCFCSQKERETKLETREDISSLLWPLMCFVSLCRSTISASHLTV